MFTCYYTIISLHYKVIIDIIIPSVIGNAFPRHPVNEVWAAYFRLSGFIFYKEFGVTLKIPADGKTRIPYLSFAALSSVYGVCHKLCVLSRSCAA